MKKDIANGLCEKATLPLQIPPEGLAGVNGLFSKVKISFTPHPSRLNNKDRFCHPFGCKDVSAESLFPSFKTSRLLRRRDRFSERNDLVRFLSW
ncbi:MAG: hypothetical protein JRN68_06230 [Nitrososphaerota archaeon]|nr:hypothetical protein [Nitrososphaerota archaeon]